MQQPKVERDKIINYTKALIVKMLEHVLYIHVPSINFVDEKDYQQYVSQFHSILATVDWTSVAGLIFDLRYNGGGNIFPMLLALGDFLPCNQALFGYDVDSFVQINCRRDIIIGLYTNSRGAQVLKRLGGYSKKIDGHLATNIPAVILINEFTGSSGAITAYALSAGRVKLLLKQPFLLIETG